MEYEIEDEERLFDDSTNPSLTREGLVLRPWREPAVGSKAAPQTAVVIPEQEHQLS